MRKYFFWMLLILSAVLLQSSHDLQAVQQETRIPAGVSMARFKLISKPAFSDAYNGYGERVPLKWLLINDEQLNDWVKGSISREETVLESSWIYGLSQDWMIEMVLPLVSKKQSSSLVLKNGAPSNSEWDAILNNLQSETLSGIGDIRLKAGYEMGASTKWFVRGGMSLSFPSGNSGTPKGVYPFSLGEQIYDSQVYLNINWYPFVTGLSNGLGFSQSSPIRGEREKMDGVKSSFLKGKILDFFYHWSYENSDFFYAFELHRMQQLESQIDGGANDQGYLNQGLIEIGWGNLNQLETISLELPWQVRFGHYRSISGERQPIAHIWQLEAQIYF